MIDFGKWIALSLLAVVCWTVPAHAQTTIRTVYKTLDDQDTLGSIALNHGVSVSELKRWNNIEQIGNLGKRKRIIIRKPVERDQRRVLVTYIPDNSVTIQSIANQFDISSDSILKWNSDLSAPKVSDGTHVRLYLPDTRGYSVSKGRASNGRLIRGIQMTEGPGIVIREPEEAFGTRRVIRMLKAAAADLQARWPDAPAIAVGDLSAKGGGPLSPHSSHQSGRDVDLPFFNKEDGEVARYELTTPDNLDAEKTWHFFKTLIDTGQVKYIFVAYPLQRALYEYAKSVGYSEEQLEPIMQYPRSTSERVGIIREVGGGHDDHVHIRFHCKPDASHCGR